MRILQITNSEGLSGGVFQMLELTKSLVKNGCEVTIACRPTSKAKEKALELGIKYVEFPLENDPDVKSMYLLFRHLWREKYDIVHAHHPKAHMIAMVASFFARTPVFVVSRRVSFSIRKGKNRFNALKYTFPRVDMIIPVCDAIKELLIKEGIKRDKLKTVHSGTDPVRFNPDTTVSNVRDVLGLGDNDIVVTKIAHYSKWKGYDTFFKAAKRVLDKNRNVKFIIAGAETDTKIMSSDLEDFGIAGSVFCLGIRSDIPELLKASDIVVNAAYEGEGLSGALREALFMGVPVVAADTAGNKDVCRNGETGILFRPKDDHALFKALITLIEDKELRKRMGFSGREHMLEEFTTDKMAERTYEIYRELLDKKKRGKV